MMKTVQFPKSLNPKQESQTVECERSIVVVGANGAGKTRLGTWIELSSPQAAEVHRVSAQRALSFPMNIRPTDIASARRHLAYGINGSHISDADLKSNPHGYKRGSRWNSAPETYLLNDYEALAVLLFSESWETSTKYLQDVRGGQSSEPPPLTSVERVKQVWESVLPHRELVIKAGTVNVRPRNGGAEYGAPMMSDGERVTFYLIGQCVSAEPGAIIVIDEPEVHLHKAIQSKLWDAIEIARPDCTFVYLTHDLAFASERVGCSKVCLRGYDGTGYDWYSVPEAEGIPEDMLLEVLGSRKPVLFVEGEQGSYDLEVYQTAFPGYTVKPLGSCEKVIDAVKAFNALKDFHHINCSGIVDRDYRSEAEILAYADRGVFVPTVAEIENLFLVEETLTAMAQWMRLKTPEETVVEVKRWIIQEFAKFKEKFALEATRFRVNMSLNSFGGAGATIEQYMGEFHSFTENIDPNSIYHEFLARAQLAIDENDYGWVIRHFNHKSLVNQVGRFFDIKPSSYTEKVKTLAATNEFGMLDGLRSYLPALA